MMRTILRIQIEVDIGPIKPTDYLKALTSQLNEGKADLLMQAWRDGIHVDNKIFIYGADNAKGSI